MRIDPRYFNLFMLTAALAVAAVIVIYTISSSSSQRQQFRSFITEADSLRLEHWMEVGTDDTLRIADFGGQFVLLDFWSTRNIYGDERHRDLQALAEQFPDLLRVVAASVRDDRQAVLEYVETHDYPFVYVNGNRLFSKYRVPGIPSLLLFDPAGAVRTVFVGYRGAEQADSLEKVIRHGS